MKIQRLAALPLSLILFAFTAPPVFATIILYNDLGNEITPFLTCNSNPKNGYPYQAACDYRKQDGVIKSNETNPNEESITYIAEILEPSLLVNNVVELGAKYETNDAATLIAGHSSIFNVVGTDMEGKWSTSSFGVERWITLKWDGLYKVYDVTGFSSGSYSADASMAISNIALFGFVPVPAAIWLFGSAIAGLVILRRRRFSVAQA